MNERLYFKYVFKWYFYIQSHSVKRLYQFVISPPVYVRLFHHSHWQCFFSLLMWWTRKRCLIKDWNTHLFLVNLNSHCPHCKCKQHLWLNSSRILSSWERGFGQSWKSGYIFIQQFKTFNFDSIHLGQFRTWVLKLKRSS